MPRGRLITIEGIDGAGKTTLAAALRDALSERSIDVLALREPGGVAVAERIRALVTDGSLSIAPRARPRRGAPPRAQLVAELVAPALEAGRWVLLDRYLDSSLAYQGAGRGLGIADVRAINEFGIAGIAADRTLLLTIDPRAGRARRGDRDGEPDRLEREADPFFAAIARGYAELAAAEPGRIRTLDATLPPEAVLAAALAELADLL